MKIMHLKVFYEHYHSNSPALMMSTSDVSFSECFRAATSPCRMSILKYLNMSLSWPPMTSTNSGVILKGELSKPRFLGEQLRMNP